MERGTEAIEWVVRVRTFSVKKIFKESFSNAETYEECKGMFICSNKSHESQQTPRPRCNGMDTSAPKYQSKHTFTTEEITDTLKVFVTFERNFENSKPSSPDFRNP